MILDLSADSSQVVKPVFDAARRQLDTARVEIGTSSLKIWGNDPANIGGIEISVDPAAFDQFKTEPGSYDTDIDAWWDVIREAKKADPIRIYTRDPEYDNLDNIPGVLTGTKRVLEDSGITTVAQLRDAPEESLFGKVTYQMEVDGEENTREGEITEGTASRLKRHFDPFVVIEIDGEDPIDSDDPEDYPRLADYGYSPKLPGVTPTTFVEVNGSDFSKAMRALSTVTEDAFVVAAEGQFILYGEGDTDTVHATPNANVGGPNAGALYSGAYLESLRLSMDRKSSVTLKLGLPDINDPKPLTANFTIRDGMAEVDWYLAPRIRSNDDVDETVPELLERVSPSNYSPLNDVRLDAVTTGGTAKAWFKLWTTKTDECRLHVDGDGLRTRVVDPANVMLQSIDLPRRVWDSYSYRGDKGTLQGVVGFPQSRLMDYVKLFRKTDEFRLQIDDKAQWGILGEHFTVTGPTIDPDSVRREPDLPALELPGRVVVDPDSFADAVDAADDVADHVILTLYDGTLYVHTEGDLSDDIVWNQVTSIEGKGYGNSLFSLDYLDDYTSAVPTGASGDIEIIMGREFPLFSYHTIEGGNFSMMLAPRISDDSKQGLQGYDQIDERDLNPDRIKNAEPLFRVNDEENDGEVHMIDEPLDPTEGPEKVAEEVEARSDDQQDGSSGTYDPTDEFEDGYGPTMDTPIPKAERQQLPGGVDEREIVGTALSASDLTDWPYINRERTDPNEEAAFEEMLGEFYDPTQGGDSDIPAEEFPDTTTEAKAAAPSTLKDQLVARGLNQFTAMHLSETYDDLAAVTAAVEAVADVTDLKGVGEGSADEVIAAFPTAGRISPSETPVTEDVESPAEPTGGQPAPDSDDQTDQELPWGARSVLKTAWGRYKRMLREYREAREEVAEYRDVRDRGAESAAEINEVRRAHGQEPIDFEGSEAIEAVPGVGGELMPGDVSSSFEWAANPYDPTQE